MINSNMEYLFKITADAHGSHEKYRIENLANPDGYVELFNPQFIQSQTAISC
jgi:hypothetical protein